MRPALRPPDENRISRRVGREQRNGAQPLFILPRQFLAGLCLYATLASCGPGAQPVPPAAPPSPPGLVIAREDVVAPDVFEFEGPAAVARATDGAGLWAAVPGLDRPERGMLQNRATGASTLAALFRAPPGGTAVISAEAADALGLDPAGTTPVLVRAIRSQLRVASPATGF